MSKRIFFYILLGCALISITSGLILRNGVHLDSIVLSPVTIEDVTLKWTSRLELDVKNVLFAPSSAVEKTGGRGESVKHIIPALRWMKRLFTRIAIETIAVGELRASFLYTAPTGLCTISSPVVDIQLQLQMAGDVFVLQINELRSARFNSSVIGELNIDSKAKTITGTVEADIAGSLPLVLSLSMDRKQFSFTGKENGEISSITPFVDLFGLSHNIQRWITDYLHGRRYELQYIGGSFPLDDPLQILETFTAKVRVDGCHYTFAPGLEPIKTDYTDVSFQKGVLDIVPHDATFYGQAGQKSWLDINFNDPANILLTAYIRTDAVANDDIMQLLEYYNIPLPFVQIEGTTDTDLTLSINLNQQQVQAVGTFLIDDGIVEYDTLPCKVQNVAVHLKNSNVQIESLDLSAGVAGHVGVTGAVNVAAGIGDFDIGIHSLAIPLGNVTLELDSNKSIPRMHYRIRPAGSTIVGGESYWKIADNTAHLDSFTVPFVYSDYSGNIPPTRVKLEGITTNTQLETTLEGTFSIRKKTADLEGELALLRFKGIELESRNSPVRITYKDGLFVKNIEHSEWTVGALPVTAEDISVSHNGTILNVTAGQLHLGSSFVAGATGSYDGQRKNGVLYVAAPHFANQRLRNLVGSEDFSVLIDNSAEKTMQLTVPELGLEGETGENGYWSAYISDLAAFHNRSPLLRKFKIRAGTVRVIQEGENEPYTIQGSIPYPYPLLVAGTTPIDHYHIEGSLYKGLFEATINDAFYVRYQDEIEVQSRGILFNVPAISAFFDDCVKQEEEKEQEEEPVTISVSAVDSGLYLSPNSQIVADSLELYSANNSIEVDLISGPGKIEIEMEGKTFLIQGDNLNDAFMNRLAPDAELRNGLMRVAAKGTFDNFTTLLEVEKTVLLDFVTLNNILAFINTIPALITFNLPSYSSSGLHVTSAVMGMKVVNGVANVESLKVKSPELGITGQGWIDFPQKKIEMDLNLITQSKKNMQKIPLVGYILAGGKKQPSITVKVSGKLEDPEVEHEVFKEVATIPFSILYRTLSLPSHIVSPLFEDEESKSEEIEGLGD